MRSRLQRNDTFVDVGANIGYYSLLASALVGPSGHVVAIEPSPSIHEELRRNVLLNESANVRAVVAAASDAIGVANMYRAGDANRGSSSLLASRGFEFEAQVPTAPLSSLLTAQELSTARIIKIDVEGHEGAVIAGLLPALAKTRPDLEILMEISPNELLEQGFTSGGLVAQLREAGFHAYQIENYYEPHRYIEGRISKHAQRITNPPDGAVAWDLVFSREDRDQMPVELV